MDWFIKFWQLLSSPIKEVIVWVFDKHLKETLVILGAIASFIKLFGKKIYNAIKNYRSARDLKKKLPDFIPAVIKRSIKYYIWPECQSVDPAQSDEARHTVAIRNDLCAEMDRLLQQDTVHRHFILLADTGMGKTSFLLNYFARHLRRWKKPFNMELIPLGAGGLQEKIKDITAPQNTVLLLDALDEDTEAIKNHTKRLSEIMKLTRPFHRVVITCRTQFFPRDEEIPVETGIIRVDPRRPGEGPQFTFYKIYLSQFSDAQIQDYLKRRFPIWQKKCRNKAQAIVDQVPNLVVRPMLLAYVDDLINSGKTFSNSFQIYDVMVDAWLDREQALVVEKDSLREFSNKLAIDLFLNSESRKGERINYLEIEPLAKKFGINLETWKLTGRSLLNRDAMGNYKFAHRSVMEFLFAIRLLDHDKDALKVPYKSWTEQINKFLLEGVTSYEKYDGKPLGLPQYFVPFQGGKFHVKESGETVEIKPFELSNYPVTNREYEEFDPAHKEKRNEYSDQDDQPAINVSWEDANNYCKWLSKKMGKSYRLPTEAEWEYAASGGGKREYPWGNEKPTPERANYDASKIGKTTPVGSYPLGMTPEGLFDMAGNVWEWCADWYDKDKYRRVLRGGSWVFTEVNLRCSDRLRNDPGGRVSNVGFRVSCGA